MTTLATCHFVAKVQLKVDCVRSAHVENQYAMNGEYRAQIAMSMRGE